MIKSYKISGMTCQACTAVVQNLISGIEGVRKVDVDLSGMQAVVEMDIDVPTASLHAALKDSLYQIEDIESHVEYEAMAVEEVLRQNETLVINYVEAVGALAYDRLYSLLDPGFQYRGTTTFRSATEYIEMIKDHARSPVANVLVKNGVKSIFVDEHECCVIYESITIFPSRTVPFAEWLEIKDGRILATEVKFNQHRMKMLMKEMNKQRE